MKKILLGLILAIAIGGTAWSTITSNYVVETDTSSPNPSLKNSPIYCSSGNCGIGTSLPSSQFHVLGAAGQNLVTDLQAPTGYGSYINFGNVAGQAGIESDTNGNFCLNFYGGASCALLANSSGAVAGTLVLNSGDVYSNAWADYSGSSTIVGWSSISNKAIYTKKVGKTVFVNFYLSGTSNATSVTFTLPYTSFNGGFPYGGALGMAEDNTVYFSAPTSYSLSTNSTVVTCYTNMLNGGWTASGTKAVQGQFWYQAQ